MFTSPLSPPHHTVPIMSKSCPSTLSQSINSWLKIRDSQLSLESEEDAETSPSGSSSEMDVLSSEDEGEDEDKDDDDINMDAHSFGMDRMPSPQSPYSSGRIHRPCQKI